MRVVIGKQEMKELVKREVIKKPLKEIDFKSRIYVDIEKVREWATSELKESFLRYPGLLETRPEI